MIEKLLNLETLIAEMLLKSSSTLSLAESCTGGMLSHIVTTIPGSSAYYLGGVCSYAIAVKESVLGVNGDIIEKKGVVSEEVAIEMAQGVKRLLQSDYALSTTGLAGPGGDELNPEGTVWMAVSGPKGTISRKRVLQGDRKSNIEGFSYEALSLLYEYLESTTEVQTTGQS